MHVFQLVKKGLEATLEKRVSGSEGSSFDVVMGCRSRYNQALKRELIKAQPPA
jgi:hypothetical protein